jgi:hypothetical protein
MLAPLVPMSSGAYRTTGISMLGVDTTCTYVVPTYNEARRLPDTIEPLMALAGRSCEVVFVDDGSDDSTVTLLESAARNRYNVRVIRHGRNRGKGAVVRDGVFAARGETVVFMDADLATDLGDVTTIRRALRYCDVAVGSRAHEDSVVEARDYRTHMGRVFNAFARGVSGLPYRDTQCGFKAFHTTAAKLLFALSNSNGFAFDVEILMLAQRLGLYVEEVAVHWKHVDGSHIRPLSDPARMAGDVLAAKAASRQTGSVSVVTVDGPGEPELLSAVRSAVRTNDVILRDEDVVHIVFGHLCPVDRREAIATRLSRALDCRANSARVSAATLVRLIQRRPRLASSQSFGALPTAAFAGVGS